jgi:hypothetical protein
MKHLFLWTLAGLMLSACGSALADGGCVLDFPEPPAAWRELLGAPQWRVEWISPGGVKESAVLAEGAGIDLPQTWASPVTAWPFWPRRGIGPGIFYPAGAVFPFDASGGGLRLSWRGGVDALVYWELAAAHAALRSAGTEDGAWASREPRNFDWPRFRELLEDPAVSEEVRLDPWRVDWKTVAAGIVSSGFDRRRIRPEAREEIRVPVSPGPWIGASPFAAPLAFGEGEAPAFPAGPSPGSWFSPAGTVRCNTETWIFIPWE